MFLTFVFQINFDFHFLRNFSLKRYFGFHYLHDNNYLTLGCRPLDDLDLHFEGQIVRILLFFRLHHSRLHYVGKSTMDIRPSNFSRIVDVLGLQFQRQTFEISPFCYNYKTVGTISITFGTYLYDDKATFVVKL